MYIFKHTLTNKSIRHDLKRLGRELETFHTVCYFLAISEGLCARHRQRLFFFWSSWKTRKMEQKVVKYTIGLIFRIFSRFIAFSTTTEGQEKKSRHFTVELSLIPVYEFRQPERLALILSCPQQSNGSENDQTPLLLSRILSSPYFSTFSSFFHSTNLKNEERHRIELSAYIG